MINCNCLNENKKRYDIFSPSENTIYPNRFWGTALYCEHEKLDDEENCFILIESEKELIIL